MLSPCDPGCNWPSVDEVLRREELLVLLCRRWVWGSQPRSSCFSSPWQPTSIYKYPSTPLGFELLNLQLDLFFEVIWLDGSCKAGWLCEDWLWCQLNVCPNKPLKENSSKRHFSWKSLIVVRRNCDTKTISLEGSDGFVSLEPPESPWVISQRQQADEDRATRLASAKTFAAAAEQLLPRRSLAKKRMDWIQWMVVAESAEKFNMPPCHELLWMLNMTCIIHDVTWHRDRRRERRRKFQN